MPLEKGEYLLFIETYWIQDYCNDLVITTNSVQPVELQELPKLRENYKEIMNEFALAYIRAQINQPSKRDPGFTMQTFEKMGIEGLMKCSTTYLKGTILFYYNNPNTGYRLKETIKINFNISGVFEAVEPEKFNENGDLLVDVPSGKQKIYIIKRVKKGDLDFRIETALKLE